MNRLGSITGALAFALCVASCEDGDRPGEDTSSSGSGAAGTSSASSGTTGGTGGDDSAIEWTSCPPAGATSAATDSAIVIDASEPLDASTVSPASVSVTVGSTPVEGELSVIGARVAFLPASLPPNATVTVSIDGSVLGNSGVPVAPGGATFSFDTGAGAAPEGELVLDPPELVPEGEYGASPMVVVDGDRAIVGFARLGASFVVERTPAGFGEPLGFSLGGDYLDMDVAAGYVDVAVFAPGALPPSVYHHRATDDLSGPPLLEQLMAEGVYLARVALGDDTRVAYSFTLNSSYWFDWGPIVATSDDGGETYSNEWMLELGGDCADIHYDGDRLHAVWVSNPGVLRHAVSDDNGASFGPAADVASPGTGVSFFYCPTIVANSVDGLWIVWEEYWQGYRTAYASFIDSATGEAAPPIELVPKHAQLACVRLATSESGGAMLWSGYEDGNGGHYATVRRSSDGGHTFGPEESLGAVEFACPSVDITSRGAFYATWQSQPAFDVVLQRGRPKRPCE